MTYFTKWRLLQGLAGVKPLAIDQAPFILGHGFLRFQAQYLRRIRLPLWKTVSPTLRERLLQCEADVDTTQIDACVAELFGLSEEEAVMVAMIAEKAQVTRSSKSRAA